jgi:hypothetical protein
MDLDIWLNKIRLATSKNEIFETLDDFRKLDWTDEQRSKMAKLYIRRLENLKPENEPAPGKQEEEKAAAKIVTVVSPTSSTAASAPTKAEAQPLKDSEPIDDGPVWYEKM